MKKVFFLTCLLLSVVMTFAQETKRVAILETVNKQGNVSYATKLILRTNIAKAITNTPGYEAYDRTDIDAIMGEQDFQRTGLVSNDQIKRVGEMTGAKYVLVTECALTSDEKMIVSVKVLDVETARVEMTDNALMLLSSEDIQRGCKELASTLFGEVSVNNTSMIINSFGKLLYKGNALDKNTYEELLQTCPQSEIYYKKGKILTTTGWALLGAGAAVLAGGITTYWLEIYNNGHTRSAAEVLGISAMGIGGGLIAISIPIWATGYAVRNNAYKVYNEHCSLSKTQSISLNFIAGQNGLGIAMNF